MGLRLGFQPHPVLVADPQQGVRERVVAHDDGPAVLVGEIRTRAMQEVAVEKQDRAGFHLTVPALEQRFERLDAIGVDARLPAEGSMGYATEAVRTLEDFKAAVFPRGGIERSRRADQMRKGKPLVIDRKSVV